MNNNVSLTDDELSVIVTSLELTLKSYEGYIEKGNQVDVATAQVVKDARQLFDRLNKDYF